MKLSRRGKRTKRTKRTKNIKCRRNTKRHLNKYKRKNTYRKHSHKLRKNKRVMRGGEGENILDEKKSLTYKSFFFNLTNNFEITLDYLGGRKSSSGAIYDFKLTMKKEGDDDKFEVTFNVTQVKQNLVFTIQYYRPKDFDVPDVKQSKDKFVTVVSGEKKLEFPLSSRKNNDFFKLLKETMNTKVQELLRDTASKHEENLKKYQESQELQKVSNAAEKEIRESFSKGDTQVVGYDDVYSFKKDLDEFKEKCSRLMATLSKNERDIFNNEYKRLIMLKITLEVKKKLLPPDDASFDYNAQISLLNKDVEKWKNEYSTKCDELHILSDREYNRVLTKAVNDKILELKRFYQDRNNPPANEKIKKLEKYVYAINNKYYNKDQSLRNQAISKFFEYMLIDIYTSNPPQHILDELSAIEERLGIQGVREEPVKQLGELSHIDERGDQVFKSSEPQPDDGNYYDQYMGKMLKKMPEEPFKYSNPDQRDDATNQLNELQQQRQRQRQLIGSG